MSACREVMVEKSEGRWAIGICCRGLVLCRAIGRFLCLKLWMVLVGTFRPAGLAMPFASKDIAPVISFKKN